MLGNYFVVVKLIGSINYRILLILMKLHAVFSSMEKNLTRYRAK